MESTEYAHVIAKRLRDGSYLANAWKAHCGHAVARGKNPALTAVAGGETVVIVSEGTAAGYPAGHLEAFIELSERDLQHWRLLRRVADADGRVPAFRLAGPTLPGSPLVQVAEDDIPAVFAMAGEGAASQMTSR